YWLDGGPGDVRLDDAPWVQLIFRDPAPDCDKQTFDDRGTAFVTRIHSELETGWVWSTLFSPGVEAWRALSSSKARFALRSRGDRAIESQLVSAAHLPARCSLKQARLCITGTDTDDWRGLVPAPPATPLPYTRAGRVNYARGASTPTE
ncbi:MAG TPA: hypothetical protein VEQ59_16785, partial [Polyangiaceae bacterium]|nr:hypothetical protein [Polyangiaceae bacterium]